MTMKRLTVIGLLAGALVVGGGFALNSQRAIDGLPADVRYVTAEVTRGSLVATVTATGRVKAVLEVKVGSQLSGQIAELFVDFNDTVTAGQRLAQLDARTYEARMREAMANLQVTQANVLLRKAAITVAGEQIASAEAHFEEAERKFKRTEALRRNNTVSQAAVDEARAEYQAAGAALRGERAQLGVVQAELKDAEASVVRQQALLTQAEIELSRTLITAPIDGVIVGRGIEEGQTVAASLEAPTLFEIAQDLTDMEVHVRVDEADIGQVKTGQPISFSVDAYPNREFSGSVVQIRKSPTLRNNVVTYTVVVSAANPDLLLLPGMTATVQLIVLEAADVVRIPNAALRFRPPVAVPLPPADDEPGAPGRAAIVWVPGLLGDPTPTAVRVGGNDGSATELLSGPLEPGEEVVVGMTRPLDRPSVFGIRLGS